MPKWKHSIDSPRSTIVFWRKNSTGGESFVELHERFGPSIRLLDVACGSGQFPRAFRAYGGLDRVRTFTSSIPCWIPPNSQSTRPDSTWPFPSSRGIRLPCSALHASDGKFPVVWATHALYCVPQSELPLALDRMLAALDPTGLGFIAHASQHSHYLRFHDLYLRKRTCPSASRSVLESKSSRLCRSAGKSSLIYWSIDYEGRLDLEDRETVERYLQRCLFDDTLSLDDMLADDRLSKYLRGCMDHDERHVEIPSEGVADLLWRARRADECLALQLGDRALWSLSDQPVRDRNGSNGIRLSEAVPRAATRWT